MYKDLNDYELIYMIRENNLEEEVIYKKYETLINTICGKYLKMAKKYNLEYSDLYNECINALSIAINKFNEKDSLFYTYANLCINSKIINLLRTNSGINRKVYNELVNYDDLETSTYILPGTFIDYTDKEICYNDINNILKEYLYNLDYNLMPIFELFINGFKMKEISILLDTKIYLVSKNVKKFRNDLKLLLE